MKRVNSIECDDGRFAIMGDYVQVDVMEDGALVTYFGQILAVSNDSIRFSLDVNDPDYPLGRHFDVSEIEAIYAGKPRTLCDSESKKEPEEDITTLKARIKELEKKAAELEKYKVYADMANEIAMVRQSFIDAGFTREEAFNMTMTFVQKGMEMAKASWRN